MRNTSLILLVTITGLAAAGCTRYDRELLGDPQAAQAAPPEQAAAPAEPAPANGETYQNVPDTPGNTAPNEVQAPAESDMFGDLDYYGTWTTVDPYGRVYRPMVPSDWSPFGNGQWAWTEYGWMWISYDPFGWATCHYGYWAYDVVWGWVWIPGYDWSPGRVDWLVCDDVICWSPMPPPGHQFGEPWEHSARDPWVRVRWKNFTDEDVGRYAQPVRYKAAYAENSPRRTAPDGSEVARVRGRALEPLDLVVNHQRIGGHDITRVTLPPAQEQIVETHRTIPVKSGTRPAPPPAPAPVKYRDNPPPAQQTNPPAGNSGGSSVQKTKPAEKSKPVPYKAQEKSGKSKSGSDKGDSSSKGKSKGR